MKEGFSELYTEFILCNKEIFISKIEDYALDIQDIESLVTTNDLTEDEKIAVIGMMNLNTMTLSIARVIRMLRVGIEKTVADKAWKLLPEKERYELFMNQIELYTMGELACKFSEFKGAYASLADLTKRHNVTLSHTEYNQKLMEYLKTIGYLTSVDYKIEKKRDVITFDEKVNKIIIGRVKNR